MGDIDPSLLRSYVAVIETGSLSGAATVVGKTVPAVFYHIKRLEAALGKRLLIRDKRGVKPSKAGGLFLFQAYDLLRHHDRVLNGKWAVRHRNVKPSSK